MLVVSVIINIRRNIHQQISKFKHIFAKFLDNRNVTLIKFTQLQNLNCLYSFWFKNVFYTFSLGFNKRKTYSFVTFVQATTGNLVI